MTALKNWLLITLLGLLPTVTQAQQAQRKAPVTESAPTTGISESSGELDRMLDQIIKREQDEIAAFSLYRPVVETYVQELKHGEGGDFVPFHDAYYLGIVDLSTGIHVHSILPRTGGPLGILDDYGAYIPEGFPQMIYIDRYHFDRKHYEFHYAGKAFLGEVRCLVFDVHPSRNSGKNRFIGRIWVEDRDYTVVRFNGVVIPQTDHRHGYKSHFDCWRVNVQPRLWLPAYIFNEELNPDWFGIPPFKCQTRFWGYHLRPDSQQGEFSDLSISSQDPIRDDSTGAEHDLSPVEARRGWTHQAEENVIDALVQEGLVARPGQVDKVLNTVLNNIEVTNNIDLDPEPHCRVMLTSNLELFSIGHTIVVSRGLLDVLPDETTLAVMLAEELSDAMAPKTTTDQYGFADILQTSATQAMKRFALRDSHRDWQAAGEAAIELLRNSPYRGNLRATALFFEQLNRESKRMPHLISAHLGNRVYAAPELVNAGPPLQPEKLDQIAALALGARIKVDPWSDEVEMMKSKQVRLQSAREKMPFEITPFLPYLTRYHDSDTSTNPTEPTAAVKGQPKR